MSEERRNPFPGLRPFEYHEYELFFGREEQYEEMIAKLSETRFLAVVGTSGSGKSSLVKAGLLPALYGGLMSSAGPNWRIALFRPKDDPIWEMALELNHPRVFGDRTKENGSSDFKLGESTNWANLCSRVSKQANENGRTSPSARIMEVLSADNRLVLSGITVDGDMKNRSQVVQLFNGILKQRDFYQPDSFRGIPFSGEVQELLAADQKTLSDEQIQKLNRLLLEASFPQDIAKKIETQALTTDVTLRRGDLGLVEVAREAQLAPDENLLIVVDQFEELFRYARLSENGPHGNQAAAFVKLLLQASAQKEIPIYVVLTMRSDYLGDCAKFWGLPEAINQGQYLIPRLTREQRREAIQGPIGLRGAKITPQLVNQLLNDMGDDPDQLPILQHALMRTWDHWEKKNNNDAPIDIDDYVAIGKMAEALSMHADEAFAELETERSQQIAERMFRCLTERGTGHSEIRRPTKVSEILSIIGASFDEFASVLNVFRKEGRSFLLPSARKPLRRESLVDISHESLIRNWKQLRKWVNREADAANAYRRLVETAQLNEVRQWGTLTDLEVAYLVRWRNENQPNLVWASRYHQAFTKDQKSTPTTSEAQAVVRNKKIFDDAMGFLDKSQDECRRKARFLRYTKILMVATVFLIVMVPLLFWQLWTMNTEGRVKGRLTYSAEMKLAQRELETGNYAEVNRLLHDPATGQTQPSTQSFANFDRVRDWIMGRRDDTELRSFEWHYFWRLSHNESATMGRYENPIISLAYLHDSSTLAMAEGNGQIRLWDPSTGSNPRIPEGAPTDPLFVAFAADRKSVAIAGQDGSIKLWELSPDLTRLNWKRDLRPAQDNPVTLLVFSPDGQYVAGPTQDFATLWPVNGDAKYEVHFASTDKTNPVSVAFSPDSRWLAVGRNGLVNLIDLSPGIEKLIKIEKLNELSASKKEPDIDLKNVPIDPPLLPPDGECVETPSNHQQIAPPAAPITSLAFSPDGQVLAMGRRDSNITLWDLGARKYLLSLMGRSLEVLSLAFSDKQHGVLASSSRDGSIKIWKTDKFSDPGYRRSLTEREACFRAVEQDLLRKNAMTQLNGHSGPVTSLVFTNDQKTIVSASDDRTLKFWSTDSKREAKLELGTTSDYRTGVSSLAFSGDSGWLAGGRYDGSATVWNVGQNPPLGKELVPARQGEQSITPVAFSKDQILAVATEGSTVSLWQMNNLNQKLRELKGHKRPVQALAFSRDGKWLATGGGDKAVLRWNVADGTSEPVTFLEDADGEAVLSLAFAPDGNTLAIGTNKSNVILWNLAGKKEAGRLKGHTDSVTSIAFSKDGTVIATASADTTAKLWYVRTRECFATFQGHSQRVLSLAFFSDGKRLVTSGEDGSVKLWTSYERGEEQTRNALITLPPQEGTKPGFVVATSTDGLTLATGNGDGTVLLRYGTSIEDIMKQSREPQ
jgi:WD40 repeat protein/energy-coupling factor transporter ATP-binding protein EcfA2